MSETLRIAFYTDSFYPAVDGVVTSIMNSRAELMRRGHEVHVFASGDASTRSMVKGQKNIYVLRGMRFRSYPQYNVALFPFMSVLKLRRINADLLHAHTPFTMGFQALMQAKIDKTPIVGSFHTLFTNRYVLNEYIKDPRLRRMASRYSWPYANFFYNRCDGVIAPSGMVKALLEKKGIANVYVAPGSVDLRRFNKRVNGEDVRRLILRGRRGRMVLYVGRLSREKRLETLIGAARRLKDKNITFVIAGTGPASAYYHGVVRRMHLTDKVRFTGLLSADMLPKFYAAADLFCIPSQFETQGLVAIEAMACGKPVVAADYLALHELVRSGYNGEKFRPGDVYACAAKIEKVLYNMDSYKGMVETSKRYSIEKTTDELLRTYRSVMQSAVS